MDFIDELLGFVVLTSPLWLILLFFIIGVWAAISVRKRFHSGGAKTAASVGILALALLVLFGDELVGRAYLNYLCSTEAGADVYHTVKLPDKYWNPDGTARFFNKHGNLDRDLWKERLDEAEGKSERYSKLFFVDRSHYQIRERTTRKLLAEVISFRYWGGWIRRNLTLHNTATSCAFIHQRDFNQRFYSRLFSPVAQK